MVVISVIKILEESKFVQNLYAMSIAEPKIHYDNKIYLNYIIHKKDISNCFIENQAI